jgi:hypothetical protein
VTQQMSANYIKVAEMLTEMLRDIKRCPEPADALLLQTARDLLIIAASEPREG